MSLKKNLLAISILSVSLNANAALTSYTGAGGVGLVYSSVSNITWMQDANLFKTMYDANNNLVNLIVALTPTYNETGGVQAIDAGDFDTSDLLTAQPGYGDIRITWYGGIAFVNYLNNIAYGGSSHWRLPTSNAIRDFDGTAGNELGELFYSELSGTAGSYIPNTSFFNNEQADAYWSGTPQAPYHAYAWYFVRGYQDSLEKNNHFYVWPVSPGLVPAVPLPAASWFMLTGLFGFFSLKRFKKQSLLR